MANNRINSDWQFRCAPLAAGYAGRWKYHRKFVFDENHDIDRL
jgi:hypothetical protein